MIQPSAQNAHAWNSQMDTLQAAYRKVYEELEGDVPGRLAAQAYLDNSTAVYHERVIGMGFLPKLFDKVALKHFEATVQTTHRILEVITKRFIEDAGYRRLFRFSPLLEQLILLPNGHSCTIPIARIDIFLNEHDGSFTFCEFNTDGTSAMNEDREVCDALANTATLQRFGASHAVSAQELFDGWVETFVDIYAKSPLAVPDPVVAIVDYAASATVHEHLEFRRRFERHGINCLVVDVSTLTYTNGALYGRDISEKHPAHTIPMRIDAIYRRAVTYELVHELEETPESTSALLSTLSALPPSPEPVRGALALLSALVEQRVCMIGSFVTQVAHSKASFCMLHHPATHTFLSEEELRFIQEHVPYTTWLKPDCIDLASVKRERERWIIKPVDGYGTVGVHAGKTFEPDTWAALIDEKAAEDYVIQEYCPQFQMLNTLPIPKRADGTPCFTNEREAEKRIAQDVFSAGELLPYNVLTGLYSYAGTLGGVYVRGGQDALIVGFRGGVTFGSLLVDCASTDTLASTSTTGATTFATSTTAVNTNRPSTLVRPRPIME